MTLLEMGGAEDQGLPAGGPEGLAPGGAVAGESGASGVAAIGFGLEAVGFGFDAGGFGSPAEDFDGAADGFDGVAAGFDGVAAGVVRGVAEGVVVRGEDEADGAGDADGVGWVAAEGGEPGVPAGCAGMPIAGASACMPIRLLPMATASTAPTRETGQPSPRSRRPRRPDWSTKTGAGAGSSKPDSDISGSMWCTDPRSMEPMTERTLRGLSLQGTGTAGWQGER